MGPIGALIPDEAYDPGLERLGALHSQVARAAGYELDSEEATLAKAMQRDMHDNLMNGPMFRVNLEYAAKGIADRFGLKYVEPAHAPAS